MVDFLSQDWLKRLIDYSESLFREASGSHDWEHTLRVLRLSSRIGHAEKADTDVVHAAAVLHDIGRSFQDSSFGKICHAEKGAELAAPLVEDLPLSNNQKQNILHCIRTHRFRGIHRPQTLEAKVIFDADKLDSIGAVGIARAYLFAGEVGAMLHNPNVSIEETASYSKNDTGYREYSLKLSKIKHNMLTSEGRKIAESRHQFMEEFFKRFLDEYRGVC